MPVLACIAVPLIGSHMLGCEGKQRQMARTLHSDSQAALVLGAGARLTARTNLASVGQVAAKQIGIFVGNFLDFVEAEIAYFATAGGQTAPPTAQGHRGPHTAPPPPHPRPH